MIAQGTPRLPGLDLLRLASALLVLLFHYGFRMAISGEGGGAGFPALSPVAIWTDIGLLIFFAISGYVIAMSAEGRTAYAFVVGRFARLWPAFVVCATITAIVMLVWPIPGMIAPTWKQWLAHAVIISRVLGQPFLDGAYWTIAYEIIFYGWVAVLMATGVFDRHWRLIVLLWLAISIAEEAFVPSGAVQKLLITEYSGYFAFGVLLFKSRKGWDRELIVLVSLAVAWASLSRLVTAPAFTAMYGVVRDPVGLMLTGPIALGAVAIAVRVRMTDAPARLAVVLGSLTYPLYLLHQHIGYATFAHFSPGVSPWLIGGVLIFVLLALSWSIAEFIETPARRFIVAQAAKLSAWRAAASKPRNLSVPPA